MSRNSMFEPGELVWHPKAPEAVWKVLSYDEKHRAVEMRFKYGTVPEGLTTDIFVSHVDGRILVFTDLLERPPEMLVLALASADTEVMQIDPSPRAAEQDPLRP